jgi:hypothetical protein
VSAVQWHMHIIEEPSQSHATLLLKKLLDLGIFEKG